VNPPGRRKEDDVNLVAKSLSPGGGGGAGHQYRQKGNEDSLIVAKAVRTPTGGIDREDMHTLVATTQKANSGRCHIEDTYIAHTLKAEGFDASEDGTGRGVPLVSATLYAKDGRGVHTDMTPNLIAYQCQGTNVGPMGTLRKGNGNEQGGGPFTIEVRGRNGECNLEYRDDGTANALRTPSGGRAGLGIGAIATRYAVRRLTPRECERLQGFPDGWTDVPFNGKPASDSARYRAIGNSMAVNVMRWIGTRIMECSQ
jgi:site-specific DNA-cytosine methylase